MQVRQAVESVPGVTRASVAAFSFVSAISMSGGSQFEVSLAGVEPDHLPEDLQSITIVEGEFVLPRGSVALDEHVAESLGVSLGDNVTFRNARYFDPVNQTGTVNLTMTAVFRGVGPEYIRSVTLIHIRDIEWFHDQLELGHQPPLSGQIRVDREPFLDPYDLEGSEAALTRLERQINTALAPFGGQVTTNYLRFALSNFNSVITFQRAIYLVLSMPVLLLGLYLGVVGVDLGHAERRRELAVVKTRGATRRQVLGLLLAEAIIGGVIAAIVGLVAGIGLSRALLGFVGPFNPVGGPGYDRFILSPSTVASVAILAVLFMAVTSYRSARRTADLPIVETLRYYAPGETKIHYRPTADIVLVVLAVTAYVMVLYARSSRGDFVTFLLGTIFFVLLPFAPVFLIIGTTRLLTRSTGRVYEWTAKVAKPFAKNLYYVVSRNLQRNPRRSANVAVIIALGIAFGLFILVTFSSQLAFQERQIRASIGADMAIDSAPEDPGFATNVSRLNDVAAITRVVRVPFSPQYGYADVYALDPESYFAVAAPESWYFRDIGPGAARQILETPDHVLATERYLQDAFLAVGDTIRFQITTSNETGIPSTVTVNMTIGGSVRGLPGAGYVGYGLPSAVFGSMETMDPLLEVIDAPYFGGDRYLVDLRTGGDWVATKEAIVALGACCIQVTEEQISGLRSDPVFRAIFGFMQLETAFMVVILTAGLGLILYAATLERDVELAAIRARGASGSQTAGLLLGEASAIMLIGLLVGAGIGALSAYLSMTLFFPGPASTEEGLVPMLFTVPVEALLLLALAPAAILVTSFVVAYRVVRMDIARVLKLRGG